MNREEAILQLKEMANNRDIELAHMHADEVLCDLLKTLGYEDVVVEYEKLEKWFA